MRAFRFLLTLAVAVALVAGLGWSAKRKKKKKADEEPVTQVLELPKDPPAAVRAETARLSFHVAPLTSKGLLSQQVRDALKFFQRLPGGAQPVKLRAFVAGTGDMRRVPMIVSEVFTEKRQAIPAVTVVQAGGLPLEGAQVVLEAIAVEKKPVNPNGLAFLSGQQSVGKDPLDPVVPLVTTSLANLRKAADAAPGEVLRVTCFVSSLEDASKMRAAMSDGFPRAAANLVQVQRAPSQSIAECEGVARLSKAPSQPLEFVNPDGLPSSPNYSQIARVSAPRVTLTSSQLAFRAQDEDVRLAFQRLGKVLEQNSASFQQVAACSYYPLTRGVIDQIRKIRPEFVPKQHPPASTLLLFEGLPSLDASFGLEVIAVARD